MEFRIRSTDYRIVSREVVLQYNIPHAAMKDDEPKVIELYIATTNRI